MELRYCYLMATRVVGDVEHGVGRVLERVIGVAVDWRSVHAISLAHTQKLFSWVAPR